MKGQLQKIGKQQRDGKQQDLPEKRPVRQVDLIFFLFHGGGFPLSRMDGTVMFPHRRDFIFPDPPQEEAGKKCRHQPGNGVTHQEPGEGTVQREDGQYPEKPDPANPHDANDR